MAELAAETAMAREIAEIPSAADRLIDQRAMVSAIAERLREFSPRGVIFCGRGSSGHVGTYLRYLVETRLGIFAGDATPSVVTAYGARPDMSNMLFVVVSQSGQSPDLVLTARAARSGGALTLAIVNDVHSPVAETCELALGIHAGLEHAVAATKTVTLSMVAGALVIAAWARDRELAEALHRLPNRFGEALRMDWSGWSREIARAPAAFVTGRGYALGSVQELALKVAETLGVPSLGLSAAELRHGPRAAITAATPILVLRAADETSPGTDDLVRDLRSSCERIFVAGGPDGTLPWIADDHPMTDPVAMLVPAYRAIESAARARGLDPDRPPHLTKITQTT
jgi:glucosamine--fructose-6-phosphate aminotransferase (isomerizing)